jgi:hypothetical protein
MAWRHAHRRWALRPAPSSEKSAKWQKMVTLRHCWHPRTLFVLAQNGLEPHAVGVPRLLIDVYSSPSLDDILSGVIDGERKLAEIAFDEAIGRSSHFAPYQESPRESVAEGYREFGLAKGP